MNVIYDEATKTVTVHFRWKKHVLPGAYDSREAGLLAGKAFCRTLAAQHKARTKA